MNIGKDWKIESDSMNVVLLRKRTRHQKDTGKAYTDWEIHGYFSTVHNALKELVNQEVRETELKDIKSIQASIDNLHQLIETATAES